MKKYNVIWNSPSKDCTGVMPIGNGDIGAGVYAIQDDALYLLLSKNDAFNFCGDIYKTGRIKINIYPNPFSGEDFTQTLDIENGCILIDTKTVKIKIWVDANNNVYNIEIKSKNNIDISAVPEFWQRIDKTKDVCINDGNQILWYFHVGDKSSYIDELKTHSVEYMAEKHSDPYMYNTFGNLIECDELELQNDKLCGSGTSFNIRVYSLNMQTPDTGEWVTKIKSLSQKIKSEKNTWQKHLNWWQQFWNRSHMSISDNTVLQKDKTQPNIKVNENGYIEAKDNGALIAQAYNVFRFLMAAQSRGKNQTKFNGGLFTQQFFTKDKKENRVAPKILDDGLMLLHEDDRLWGSRYTFQNQRLLYWPMFAFGDFDFMSPFFDFYYKLLEIRKAVTKEWFGHDGAYYRENVQPTGIDVPETDEFGVHSHPAKTKRGEPYEGWYHDYYFTCSLEIVVMMIEYVKYTGDMAFRDTLLTPMAREVLTFYDKHYERDENGKFIMEPSQVLETFWIAVNPAPDIAGLHCVLRAVLDMGIGTDEDKNNWNHFISELPPVPLHVIDGQKAIAPAEKYEKKRNAENGELYPVFPFTLFGVGYATEDIVKATMKHRVCPDSMACGCWSQDQIDWAHAGEAVQARDGLIKRFKIASTQLRFPFFGRENPDSCPDFDHFGSGAVALQRMLVQETDDSIIILPAWPANWDVKFKLNLKQNTYIEGEVKDGVLLNWNISPTPAKKVIIKKSQ